MGAEPESNVTVLRPDTDENGPAETMMVVAPAGMLTPNARAATDKKENSLDIDMLRKN